MNYNAGKFDVAVIGAGVLTAGVWFALASIVAMAIAAFVGIIYTPALYCSLKDSVDKNIVGKSTDYVGAKKTSTREKRTYEKKKKVAPVVEKTVEETVEETVAKTTTVTMMRTLKKT